MKKLSIILIGLASFALSSSTNANITNMTAWSANSTYVTLVSSNWDGNTTYLTINASQLSAGSMMSHVWADSPGDPTLTIRDSIDNDTGFTWNEYKVNIYLPTNFAVTAQTVIAPVGWSVSLSQDGNTFDNISNEYKAELDFLPGTPIPVTGTLDFSYKMTFTGLSSFTFQQEFIPIPEPSTLGLVAIGGLLLARFTLGRGRRKG